jgi:hypothetical protein
MAGDARKKELFDVFHTGHSPNEHKESRLVAYNGDVPLAGRGVF